MDLLVLYFVLLVLIVFNDNISGATGDLYSKNEAGMNRLLNKNVAADSDVGMNRLFNKNVATDADVGMNRLLNKNVATDFDVEADPKIWRCDYTFNQDCNCWIKFHEVPNTWHEAQLRCIYEGAVLASPMIELIDIMKNIIQFSRIPSQKIFIGIHAIYSKGNFFSVEGAPLTDIPRKWAERKPDDTNVEDCLTMNQYGTLIDASCNATYPFVCYRKNDGKELNNCGTTDQNYIFDERTGSCYKFHRFPHSWKRAYYICGAEGGYLTVINSETEANVIKELFTKNPETIPVVRKHNNSAFVGFRDLHDHGTWVTVQGQSLWEAGYETFLENEPFNKDGNEHCGASNYLGLLHDMQCDFPSAFICEKDPSSYC